MDIRDRILDAAKKVYAQHGFRGATTRLIAIEAGVNEVTLFRIFGSKAALFEALMQGHVAQSPIPALPDNPVDPEREMTDWCRRRARPPAREQRAHSHVVRRNRRSARGRGLDVRRTELRRDDPHRLRAAVCSRSGIAAADGDIPTAVAMLMSSMFGDAISRDVMPTRFPAT